MVGGSRPSGSCIVRSSAIIKPYLGLFPLILPTFFHLIFHTNRLLGLFHTCCVIHTPCMGSPFPTVYARWSLVFRLLATSSQQLKAALNLVYNNNVKRYVVSKEYQETLFSII